MQIFDRVFRISTVYMYVKQLGYCQLQKQGSKPFRNLSAHMLYTESADLFLMTFKTQTFPMRLSLQGMETGNRGSMIG
jgi:hypothetical protein